MYFLLWYPYLMLQKGMLSHMHIGLLFCAKCHPGIFSSQVWNCLQSLPVQTKIPFSQSKSMKVSGSHAPFTQNASSSACMWSYDGWWQRRQEKTWFFFWSLQTNVWIGCWTGRWGGGQEFLPPALQHSVPDQAGHNSLKIEWRHNGCILWICCLLHCKIY